VDLEELKPLLELKEVLEKMLTLNLGTGKRKVS